jgi:hypothetical protein
MERKNALPGNNWRPILANTMEQHHLGLGEDELGGSE